MSVRLAIVDTGGANHASIQNAFARLGLEPEVTLDTARLERATHLILPGVGHAAHAMERLKASGVVPYLRALKKPTLGICLGLQILFETSEEGDVAGLGVIPGRVTKMPASPQFRVPHMGWTKLQRTGKDSRLLEGLERDAFFYFVHSYQAPPSDWTVATADAPIAPPAVIECRNFFATQFHPERSSEAGSRLLKNFLAVQP